MALIRRAVGGNKSLQGKGLPEDRFPVAPLHWASSKNGARAFSALFVYMVTVFAYSGNGITLHTRPSQDLRTLAIAKAITIRIRIWYGC